MARFSFTDLHSFKDYVTFVQISAASKFPIRPGLDQSEQWTLDLAFEGLRLGLKMAAEEKGERPVFVECRGLVEDAYEAYKAGNKKEGIDKLESVKRLLRRIKTR